MDSASTGRRIDLLGRGATWAHDIAGPAGAPVLLLLHGLAATALLNWSTSFAALARGFRVVALDHRGHGRGIRRIGAFKLEDCADDAAALVDRLGVERVIPVGYSMGGALAQLFWRRHPERTAGLVLCATGARFGGPRAKRAASALGPLLSLAARVAPQSVWDDMGERMLENVQDPGRRLALKEELATTEPASVIEAAAALARFDSNPWLGEVDVPAAVVQTEQDGHIPPRYQALMADAIPGAEVHRVDADHYACVARPDLFVPTLFRACRSVALRGTPVRGVSAVASGSRRFAPDAGGGAGAPSERR